MYERRGLGGPTQAKSWLEWATRHCYTIGLQLNRLESCLMQYLALALAVLATGLTILHQTMAGKVYDYDKSVLSRFALPRVIRREYSVRFGKDSLYWCSKLSPILFAIIVLFMIATVLMKTRL
jgi:hypothetical protein